MKFSFRHVAPVIAGVMLLAGLMALPAWSDVKKGKSRPLTTSQLMKGLAKPSAMKIKDALKEGPKTDEDWDLLATHAALMNEVSYILMADGRCPDKTWADASTKNMRAGSAALIAAIKARNAEDAQTAFGAMMKSCKACHTKHKE